MLKCFKISTFGQTIIMLCSCDKETHMHQVNVLELKKKIYYINAFKHFGCILHVHTDNGILSNIQ